MPQVNTIAMSNFLPSQGLGNQTSETQFKGSDGNILTVYVPTTRKMEIRGKSASFVVMVGGRVTTGTTSNFTPKLYWGNSTTIGNNTGIAAPSAVSLASLKRPWQINAYLLWDETGQRLSGYFNSQIGDSYGSHATLSANPTSVDLTAGDVTTVGLSITALFGSSNASNTAFVDYFEIQLD